MLPMTVHPVRITAEDRLRPICLRNRIQNQGLTVHDTGIVVVAVTVYRGTGGIVTERDCYAIVVVLVSLKTI